MMMPLPRVEEKLTGWMESHSQSTRKQSIKQVISKLHELSNGLFAKGMLSKYHPAKSVTERCSSSSKLDKSQTLLAAAAVPSNRMTLMKMRHTSSALHNEASMLDDDLLTKGLTSRKMLNQLQPE